MYHQRDSTAKSKVGQQWYRSVALLVSRYVIKSPPAILGLELSAPPHQFESPLEVVCFEDRNCDRLTYLVRDISVYIHYQTSGLLCFTDANIPYWLNALPKVLIWKAKICPNVYLILSTVIDFWEEIFSPSYILSFIKLESVPFSKILLDQCCGAGAARSRNFWLEPEPEHRSFGSGSGSAKVFWKI
jgi:hypothetical protein